MAAKNDKILKEFGKNIRELRIAKGMSTRQFAYDADISHSSVGRLEAGFREEGERVAHLPVLANLEVQMRARAEASRAHQADLFAARDQLTLLDVEALEVAVEFPVPHAEFWQVFSGHHETGPSKNSRRPGVSVDAAGITVGV